MNAKAQRKTSTLRILGQVISCFWLAAILLIHYYFPNTTYWYWILMILASIPAIAGGHIYDYGVRKDCVTLSVSSINEKSRSILYLRSFKRDNKMLAWNFWKMTPISMRPWTFEQELIEILEQSGEVITLANPYREVQALGAKRISIDDTDWRNVVHSLIRKSHLIIILADYTPSLQWEFAETWKMADKSKIIIVLPPSLDRTDRWRLEWNQLRAVVKSLPLIDAKTIAVGFTSGGDPLILNKEFLTSRASRLRDFIWARSDELKKRRTQSPPR